MNLAEASALLTDWLDGVNVASATERALEHQAANTLADETPSIACATEQAMLRVALHEGGHAFVAHRSGRGVRYARLRPDATGAVLHDSGDDGLVDLLDDVRINLAGPAVELLLGTDEIRRSALKRSHDVLLARLTADRCRALRPTWELPNRMFASLAVCAVCDGLPVIDRLARALIALRQLDGPTVAALCEQRLQ